MEKRIYYSLFTMIALVFVVNCQSNQGVVKSKNGKKVKSKYYLKCTPPLKTYTKDLIAKLNASIDSVGSLPKTEFKAQLDSKVVKLAQFTSEGLDKDLFYFRMCEMLNNNRDLDKTERANIFRDIVAKFDEERKRIFKPKLNIDRITGNYQNRELLFTVSNFNDFDQDLKISQMYLDFNVVRRRDRILGIYDNLPPLNDTKSGRIDLGEFELNSDKSRLFIDNSDIFKIEKNNSAHFKLKIKGSIDICRRCMIIVRKSDLVIEFVEPEHGNVAFLRKHINLRFVNGALEILPN